MQSVFQELLENAGTDHILAPYQSTPYEIIEDFLNFAQIMPEDFVVEIGCGDARLLVAAAKQTEAKFFGFEIDEGAFSEAEANVTQAEHQLGHSLDNLHLSKEDVLKVSFDWTTATVIFMYMTKSGLRRLWPFLKERLLHGTRVLCIQYSIDDAIPDREMETSYFDHKEVEQCFKFYSYIVDNNIQDEEVGVKEKIPVEN
mmetsp:Transcript_10244/g.13320  ORF Transcript_10244/g.13320 Transcript_10244/m.13320 type:complete len:200 (-) Transcript_10244:309-908(-)